MNLTNSVGQVTHPDLESAKGSMSPAQRFAYLSSLREEVAKLAVVKCRMSHEQVLRDAKSKLPIVCSFPEGAYKRLGLCSPDVRAQRLACSHTTARIRLEAAINAITPDREERPEHDLRSELNLLNNEIHLLDHRKGEAEKELACVVAEIGAAVSLSDRRITQAEEEVRTLELLHSQYVESLAVLRQKAVIAIDKLIEDARRDMRDFEEMNRAYAEQMGSHRPARTVIGVSDLPKPGALLTMNLTAVVKEGTHEVNENS